MAFDKKYTFLLANIFFSRLYLCTNLTIRMQTYFENCDASLPNSYFKQMPVEDMLFPPGEIKKDFLR